MAAPQPQAQEEELLKTPLFENLRKLVTIIDELRDIGLQEYISLPRIAVVGSQSSGKSSLLENVVGLDFLPRGEGLVTRRPLEMRLVHVPNSQRTWAVFEECKDEKFSNFDKVRDKINELTDKIAKKNKGIVKDQIVLTIYSDDCPDLTLIDLPGITRIPLPGSDQPQDIEKVTKEIVYHYIKDERTIILVVIPANADMSTSDGLQMARKLDPDGKRTIGVITKIDIMDKGTDARKMLLNQEIPLKLGYVGVRNRSQLDINSNMRVQRALKQEQEYFAKHPVYSTMPQNLLGTRALTQKLSTVMFHHIRAFLPQIVKEIQLKIKDCEERLKDLGPPMPSEYTEKMHLIWNMVTDFTETFKNQIQGKYEGKRSQKFDKNELSGGAIIKMMFNDLYDEFAKQSYTATQDYSDQAIEKAIVLHQGDSIPGFPSIDSFLYLIQPQLEKLKDPAFDTLLNVFGYLDTLSQKLVEKIFARFPAIIDEVQEQASKVLQEERDKAKDIVENIIDAELGYLFTNDSNYLTQRTSIIPQQQIQEVVDANKAFIKELRLRIDSYFDLVVHNVRDTIPKTIGYFLVKSSQEKMQYSLYTEVMKNESILQNLGEPPHIAQERSTITRTLNTLRKAQKVLKRDPEFIYYLQFNLSLASYSQKQAEENPEMDENKKVKRIIFQVNLQKLLSQQQLQNLQSQQGPQVRRDTSLFGQ